ncbi:hypothetical protein CVT25_010382 [Psilocybe cyanescens]|uniref:Uncharacterized protein n=1 Tax=Psilocybe cyanescens TaxID=93625 RepID=A0A409XP43_PSICY|nr:hypothetical protein CVT25_010382 [Psilocybe cyanescens]
MHHFYQTSSDPIVEAQVHLCEYLSSLEMLDEGCTYCTITKTHGIQTVETCTLAGGKPCSPCADIIDLNAQIVKAKEGLAKLLNRHRQLRQEKNRVHEPIIHRLPPEVASVIFSLALSEARHDRDKRLSRRLKVVPATTPLTLGAVCRTWRNVAWESPYLWARVSISIIAILEDENPTYLDNAREWLSRAGQLPLAIHAHIKPNQLMYMHHGGSNFYKKISSLAAFINDHLPRCRDLDIDCGGLLLAQLNGDAPILNRLRIASNYICDLPDGGRSAKMQFGCPRALHVSLAGYPIESINIEWEKVTHFEGVLESSSDCFELLSRALQLVHCHWDFVELNSSDILFKHGMISKSMQSLKLEANSHQMQRLFSALALPALTRLELNARQTPLPHYYIASFFQRSSCNLTSLTLNNISCSGRDSITLMLKAAPSLKQLQILTKDGLDYGPDILFPFLGSTSVFSQDQAMILPNLELLTIRFYADVGFPWIHIPKMFGSIVDIKRPQKRRPLNTLRIIHDWEWGNHWNISPFRAKGPEIKEHLSNEIDKDVVRQLLKIAEAGITLDIRDVYYKIDLLKAAMERHSIEVPTWYNIKVNRSAALQRASPFIPVVSEHDGAYESEYATSEESAEETNADLEEPDRYDLDSDESDSNEELELVSNASDLSYDSQNDDLAAHVTGETAQML